MINDVLQQWPLYRLLLKAMYVGINSPNIMATVVSNIGPLPDDPDGWDDWLHAFAFIKALNNAIQVTDATLKNEEEFVVATNVAASIVALPAPTAIQVSTLINQLQVVNGFIQDDERFHYALQISKAVAADIGTNLGK
jgi:hypothetical protein